MPDPSTIAISYVRTMSLTLGADTRAEMVRALYDFADQVDMGFVNGPSGCSAGCGSGYSYAVKFGDRPTHEEYIAALNAYLERPAAGAVP